MSDFWAVTTGAETHGNGTTSAWFETDKNKIDQSLVDEFFVRFKEIKKVHSVSLLSKEKEGGFSKNSSFAQVRNNKIGAWK